MNKSPKDFLNEGTEAARLYARAEIEQFKLKFARRLTRYSAGAIRVFLLIAIGAVSGLFFTLALALAWGKAIHSYAHAFLYMGIIVFGILIVVALLSKWIITKPVLRRIIKELFEDKNE